MQKFSRKLCLFLFTFVLMWVGGSMNFYNINATTNKTSVNGATYTTVSVPDEKDIGYGILYRRELATTSLDVAGKATGNAAGLGGGGPVEVGVDYPQQVNVLEFKLSSDLQLVNWAVLSGSSWNLTSVRNAAKIYEDQHRGWKVVAAINGDFFNISNTHESIGVTVSQGEYFKATSGNTTIAIKNDGIGKQLFKTTAISSSPFLSVYDENDDIIKHIAIDKINQNPSNNEIALFATPGSVNATNAWLVANAKQALDLGSFYGKGKITSFENNLISIKSGEFAVVSNNDEISELLKTGVTIRAQYEFTDPSLAGIENFVGVGGTAIIDNGAPNDSDKNRHPRTVIGQKEDGTVVCAVIDGRQVSKEMYGATFAELAAMMTQFGCIDAWNLDGGGSSTMIVRKQEGWDYTNAYKDSPGSDWYVTNSPSDASERNDGNCLLLVTKVPEVEFTVENITSDSLSINVIQLTELEKYKELYISINGIKKKVVDGKASFTGLEVNTSYKAILYSKINDEYRDLLSYCIAKTAFELPILEYASFDLALRNGVENIAITFNFVERNVVTRISLKIGEKEYSSGTLTIYIPKTAENLEALKALNVTIMYNLTDGKGNQTMSKNEIIKIVKMGFVSDAVQVELESSIRSILTEE